MDPGRLSLMGDWNAKGSEQAGVCVIDKFDFIDRYRIDLLAREMWTWTSNFPSTQVISYLDKMLVRNVNVDLLDCPTFAWLGYLEHKLVFVRMALGARPKTSGHRKDSLSLHRTNDFAKDIKNTSTFMSALLHRKISRLEIRLKKNICDSRCLTK